MSLSVSTIATGIAALSVSGVTILDLTAIPDQVQGIRDCPIMYPHPDGFITGGNGDPSSGPATFGTPTTRFWMFLRGFQYVYLHAAVGSQRGISDHYDGMSTNLDAIMQAITALDLTQIDVENIAVGQFGVLQDTSGNSFFGFTLTITLREKVNA